MPLKTHHDDAPAMNMTPMIDVVFLLIIFFMAGTKFTELEKKLGLTVPQVNDVAALTAAPEKKVVNIYRDGQISLDRSVVTLDELTARLASARRQYADVGVLVRGDANVPFQNVASVLTACRQAGIHEMGISVRLARNEKQP
jgi:biopolymer transport protein ExbD